MKPIVELIAEWDAFVATHKDATVADFCRYYLAKQKVEASEQLFSGMVPPDPDTVLAKLIGRLAFMQGVYSKMALREMEGVELDWFYFLNAIYHRGEAQKKDVISYHFTEQSTGMDMLRRLHKSGYTAEREDPADKRAKLVRLTPKGEQLLHKLYELLHKPTMLMFHGMPEEAKKLLIQLLSPLEIKHGHILSLGKQQHIDDILSREIGNEEWKEKEQALAANIKKITKRKRDGGMPTS